MPFVSRTRVRFSQVDPAGIVFYPRYFEMLNVGVEDWFSDVGGVDFATLHLERKVGVPTISLTCTFVAPSRLGDLLDVELTLKLVGRSSAAFDYRLSCADELRLHGEIVLVCMDLTTSTSMPWPDYLRQNMNLSQA